LSSIPCHHSSSPEASTVIITMLSLSHLPGWTLFAILLQFSLFQLSSVISLISYSNYRQFLHYYRSFVKDPYYKDFLMDTIAIISNLILNWLSLNHTPIQIS
jgi:hypothetical protein